MIRATQEHHHQIQKQMKALITRLKLALFLRIGESLGFNEIGIDHADGAVTSITFVKQ